jgi:hypothetical protein
MMYGIMILLHHLCLCMFLVQHCFRQTPKTLKTDYDIIEHRMPNELKKQVLDQFWSIYDTEGTVQALNWLESLKYYEDYCILSDDVSGLTSKLGRMTMK